MSGIGIIGFGFMGRTHLAAYRDNGAVVIAIADGRRESFASSSAGNIEREGDGDDLTGVDCLTDADELLARPDIDAVSICAPTPLHVDLTIAALAAGKHVLVEKPLALNSADADRVVAAAAAASNLICMPAMCMRFWPGWRELPAWIRDVRYGRLHAARFTRIGAAPNWNPAFYQDPGRSGGAIMDLHIHDCDFVRYCFGEPIAVHASGAADQHGAINHVTAHYELAGGPSHVTATGSWIPPRTFPFSMQYLLVFEDATLEYDSRRATPLLRYAGDEPGTPVDLDPGTGYRHEIAHFLSCIDGAETPSVTVADGAAAVALIEAERRSIAR